MAKEKKISKVYGPLAGDLEHAKTKGILIPQEEDVREELRRGAENMKAGNFNTPARTAGSDDEQGPQRAHMLGGPQKGRK